jgi:hypothetical protein
MRTLSAGTTYVFCIDTDSYAGNFERPLAAACTGQIGDCEVGQDRAEKFEYLYPKEYQEFRMIIDPQSDEHGCARPVSIYPSPGFWNDGLGNEYPDAEWGQPHTIEAYRKAIVEHKADHLDPQTAMPGRHAAYQSVAIFFHERPTDTQLAFMVDRAREFVPDRFEGSFKITGFRLVEEIVEPKINVLWSAEP